MNPLQDLPGAEWFFAKAVKEMGHRRFGFAEQIDSRIWGAGWHDFIRTG
jgi:hypothetical protein